LPILLLPIWECCAAEKKEFQRPLSRWRDLITVAVIFAGSMLLMSSNSQLGEGPFLALGALYGAEMILRRKPAPEDSSYFMLTEHLEALLLLLLFILPAVFINLETFRYSTTANLSKGWESTPILQSTQLRDFRFFGGGATRAAEMRGYQQRLDEGIQLLRRHPDATQRLNVMLFSNPFSFALGVAPASGGIICVEPILPTFNKAHHPPVQFLVGNAAYIMTDRGSEMLRDGYGAEWDALQLQVVEETTNFSLFKVPQKTTASSVAKAETDSGHP
jgi:hypothetical protein